MKLSFAIFSLLSLSTVAKAQQPSISAESVFRIEFDQDYKHSRESDLKKRVWELERAVWQLQHKVFQLESSQGSTQKGDIWLCKIQALGDVFTGTGGSKAVATEKAIDKCKSSKGDGFFCKNVQCEQ